MLGSNHPDLSARLDRAVAEYMLRVDRGERVDREAFMAEHADLAEGLREYFGESDAAEDAFGQRGSTAALARPNTDIPRRLGDYELLEELGRGGMGTVYKAKHTRLQRVVALKTVAQRMLEDPEAVERFRREIAATGTLDHENLVQAHDAREVSGTHFLVMEFIDGIDVRRLLKETGPLSIPAAAEIARQAAVGLDAIHRRGLVHRDVKPTNLMVTHQGTVKLLDLGLALFRDGSFETSDMTATGAAMGTVDYMAPEQALDAHQVDPRADLYSLGCSLYCLLSGKAPFDTADRASNAAKIQAHISATPRPIRDHRADVPEPLAALVHQLLAKKPEDRPGDAAEVARRLIPYAARGKLRELLQQRSLSQGLPVESNREATSTEPWKNAHVDTCVEPPSDATLDRNRMGKRFRAILLTTAGLAAIILVAFGLTRTWPPGSLAGQRSSDPAGIATVQEENDTSISEAVDSKNQHAVTASLTITDLRVTVHRGEYADLVGNVAEGVFDARFNDDVRVYATLSEPCYCFLLALNPDGSEQLCYPSDAEQPPERAESLEFPGRAITFFGLTDGVGLQGFVLLASRQPLPAFVQWRESVGDVGWAATGAEGVWKYDGQHVNRVFSERGVIRQRGVLRERVPRTFADACRTFSEAPRIQAAQAIAFPVVASDQASQPSDN